MKKLLLILLATVALSHASAQFTSDQIKHIDASLNYLHQRGMFDGSIVLAEHGKVIYSKSLGNISSSSKEHISSSSAFNLASISKQFMAMMIMILKEHGNLNYDDPVNKYLTSFPYNNITIRNLLNHTSGLSEYSELSLQYRNTLDTIDNLSLIHISEPTRH